MKVIGKMLAGFFSILYFFILTALIMVTMSLNLLSTSYYTNIIKSADFKSMKIADLAGMFSNDTLNELEEKIGVEDATVEDLFVAYLKEGGVPDDLAIAVINNQKIREVVGKFIGEFINYNISGEKPSIAREDIEAVLNEKDVQELLNFGDEKIEVNNDTIDELYEELNDLIDEMIEDGGETHDNTKRIENNSVIN